MILQPLHAARKLPASIDWAEMAAALAVLTVLAGGMGFFTGLVAWSPVPPGAALWLAAVMFIFPALAEELVFRGFLPSLHRTGSAGVWVLLSTAAFVAWHPAQTLLLGRPEAFLRPDFLVCVGFLGLLCAVLRMRSGSIWTPVVLHWSVAWAWIALFGGLAD